MNKNQFLFNIISALCETPEPCQHVAWTNLLQDISVCLFQLWWIPEGLFRTVQYLAASHCWLPLASYGSLSY